MFTIIVCNPWVTFLSKAFGGGHAFGWGWYDSPGHGGGPIGTQAGGGRIEGDIIINTKDYQQYLQWLFRYLLYFIKNLYIDQFILLRTDNNHNGLLS